MAGRPCRLAISAIRRFRCRSFSSCWDISPPGYPASSAGTALRVHAPRCQLKNCAATAAGIARRQLLQHSGIPFASATDIARAADRFLWNALRRASRGRLVKDGHSRECGWSTHSGPDVALSACDESTVGRGIMSVICVAAVCHLLARPSRGLGIALPVFVSVITTAFVALLFSHRRAAPLAYTVGSVGTLIGADLLNLGSIQGLGVPIASIGGAGTFDGIFLTGVLAVLFASLKEPPDCRERGHAANTAP